MKILKNKFKIYVNMFSIGSKQLYCLTYFSEYNEAPVGELLLRIMMSVM